MGPGNGLFEFVQRRAGNARSWDIEWKPERMSASCHGRDLFAPVAAMLARGEPLPGQPRKDCVDRRPDWPDDLSEIVYIDHFGNAMTGLRAAMLPRGQGLLRLGSCWNARRPSVICRPTRLSAMSASCQNRKSGASLSDVEA